MFSGATLATYVEQWRRQMWNSGISSRGEIVLMLAPFLVIHRLEFATALSFFFSLSFRLFFFLFCIVYMVVSPFALFSFLASLSCSFFLHSSFLSFLLPSSSFSLFSCFSSLPRIVYFSCFSLAVNFSFPLLSVCVLPSIRFLSLSIIPVVLFSAIVSSRFSVFSPTLFFSPVSFSFYFCILCSSFASLLTFSYSCFYFHFAALSVIILLSLCFHSRSGNRSFRGCCFSHFGPRVRQHLIPFFVPPLQRVDLLAPLAYHSLPLPHLLPCTFVTFPFMSSWPSGTSQTFPAGAFFLAFSFFMC